MNQSWYKLVPLASLWLGSVAGASEKIDYTAAVVYTLDGKGDGSFADGAWEGVKRVTSELKCKILELEPDTPAGRVERVNDAVQQGVPLIIAIGYDAKDTIVEAAKKYPKTRFAIVDEYVDLPNVASLQFKEHEGSFLVGYVAGKFSKSGKVGYIGAMNMDLLARFEAGYTAGVKFAVPNVTVLVDYLGVPGDFSTFNNPTRAKKVARAQYNKGADVIFAAAGGSGEGLFAAAREVKKYAVGVDVNQNGRMPGHVIVSMLKRVDTAVYHLVKDQLDGVFIPGKRQLGIKEDGVDIAIDNHTRKLVPDDILKEIPGVKAKVTSGEVKVPDTL